MTRSGNQDIDGLDASYADFLLDDVNLDDNAEEEGAGIAGASSLIMDTLGEPIPQGTPIYRLRLSYSHESFFAFYKGEVLPDGSRVIVPTRYGRDIAEIIGRARHVSSSCPRMTRIERVASEEDLAQADYNKEQEIAAFAICKEKIEQNDLPMKLICVHYLFEEVKVLFFFTAETRIDFRELVKDITNILKVRVELRQIGIRDESRIIGGMGVCGRPYCCNTIFDKLKPVTIKMAKEQNLALSSGKISGSCGRLLCCLGYEHCYYSEQRKFYPPEGSKLEWDNAVWTVREVNIILELVTLGSDDGRQLTLPCKRFEKIEKNNWRIINI